MMNFQRMTMARWAAKPSVVATDLVDALPLRHSHIDALMHRAATQSVMPRSVAHKVNGLFNDPTAATAAEKVRLTNFLIVRHRCNRWRNRENLPGSAERSSRYMHKRHGDILGADEADNHVDASGRLVTGHDNRLNKEQTQLNGAFLSAPTPLMKDCDFGGKDSGYRVGALDPNSEDAVRFPKQKKARLRPVPYATDFATVARRDAFANELKYDAEKPDETAPRGKFVASYLQDRNVFKQNRKEDFPICFDFLTIQMVNEAEPGVVSAVLTDHNTAKPDSPWREGMDPSLTVTEAVKATGAKIWMPEQSRLTKEQVLDAHRLGLKVIPYFDPNIDRKAGEPLVEPETAARFSALIAMGVDGLDVDHSGLAAKALKKARWEKGL